MRLEHKLQFQIGVAVSHSTSDDDVILEKSDKEQNIPIVCLCFAQEVKAVLV